MNQQERGAYPRRPTAGSGSESQLLAAPGLPQQSGTGHEGEPGRAVAGVDAAARPGVTPGAGLKG
jgi:hypothetical protein